MSKQGNQELPPLGELGDIARETSDQNIDPKTPLRDAENKVREESEGSAKFENQKAPGKFEGDQNKGKFEEGKNSDASGKFEGRFESKDKGDLGKFESKDKDNLGKFESADKKDLGKFEGKFESNEKDRLGKFEGNFEHK